MLIESDGVGIDLPAGWDGRMRRRAARGHRGARDAGHGRAGRFIGLAL